ncbi:hypothetical protein [Amycolatopsis pithecellobii]|uniref:Uncharacterized protein n=1 Tax=Amycolatopsis pithecellobii TaxID=664692 RepID=A0A6N7YM57_9PSEU|nr:hypothetical protein [Amycolatopsis pithecellobii]MTD54045.1 hypothetical protein [Amycolatopsis pithecellobii]
MTGRESGHASRNRPVSVDGLFKLLEIRRDYRRVAFIEAEIGQRATCGLLLSDKRLPVDYILYNLTAPLELQIEVWLHEWTRLWYDDKGINKAAIDGNRDILRRHLGDLAPTVAPAKSDYKKPAEARAESLATFLHNEISSPHAMLSRVGDNDPLAVLFGVGRRRRRR